MEQLYDWRALLLDTSFSESPKSAVEKLLATDPFDFELENYLNDVLEDRGVELWGPEYDKAIFTLQNYYMRNRKNGLGFVSDFNFSQQCGASYISSSYTCRVGAESGLDYKRVQTSAQVDSLEKKYAAFEEAISGYSPEAQKEWKSMVQNSIDGLNAADQRTDLSDEKATKYYDRILTNAKIMAEDGPPTKILDKSGNEVAMSDKIYPVMSRTGNMAWKDPAMQMSYTKHRAGEMTLEQNRPSPTENIVDGRAKAAIRRFGEYKDSAELQAKGEFGSPGMARQREVTQTEIDSRWAKMSAKEKEAASWSGVDSVGNRKASDGGIDQRSEHRAFYERNPDLLEARGKEVIAAYLQQTPGPGQPARSAFTNEEIPLPGMFGPGGKGVVDHYVPLSSGYPAQRTKPWSREEGLKVLLERDTRSNMVIVEGGLNVSKGNRENWSRQIIPGWERRLASYDKDLAKIEKMPSFTSGARGSAPKPTRASRTTAQPKQTAAPKVRAQRANQTANRAATKAAGDRRKAEAAVEKLGTKIDRARVDRNKQKPGSAAYKKKSDEVNKLLTQQRAVKKAAGLV